MKKLLLLICTLSFVPVMAQAAWWKPTTWFGQKTQIIEAVQSPIITPEPTLEATPIVTEIIVERPVEKIVYKDRIVEKVVTDTSSALQLEEALLKYKELEAKYTDVQGQLTSMTSRLNVCKAEKAALDEVTNFCNTAQDEYAASLAELTKLETEYNDRLQKHKETFRGTTGGSSAVVSILYKDYLQQKVVLQAKAKEKEAASNRYCK